MVNREEIEIDIDRAWVILGPEGEWYEIHRTREEALEVLEEHYGALESETGRLAGWWTVREIRRR